eukprot:CAMPEP_0204430444 /NCGR_PEP_ID=MMETSP0470-20130426/62506_1 /ASSEMBLY_ACC=CAM_ASM_000385 /TAXON_ID=2969 /ORGANISM="Oxyrrhis marina" /LENGTH=34 /DNA_ID= /DNA_START= /DNA_END= /DNA_ORIENTATION=
MSMCPQAAAAWIGVYPFSSADIAVYPPAVMACCT